MKIKLLILILIVSLAPVAHADSLWQASTQAGDRPSAICDITNLGCVNGVSSMALVPVEKIADEFGRDLYWVVGSHAADLYSTAWALHRCPTCAEGNIFGPTAEARIAMKMATLASTGMTLWKLRRDGHGKSATILRWTYVAINSVFVVNNTVHAIRKK